MKIKKIILENHPIFGLQKIEFDFTKENGEPYNNILFVGENGSGKSTLLEKIIFQFTNIELIYDGGKDEVRSFVIDLTEDEESIIVEKMPELAAMRNELTLSYNCNINDRGQIKCYLDGNEIILNAARFAMPEIKNIFKAIFTPTEINFSGTVPRTSTNKDIDGQVVTSTRAPSDLGTDIIQLLIDISVQDNAEGMANIKSNPGIVPDFREIDKRTRRFQNAFKIIFENNLSFSGLDHLNPMFKKGATKFEVKDLSSGEKQIVFRGGFLLKDQNSLKGAPVLIDEPEISLHPARQLKILNYYRAIFTDINSNEQTSQLFITTHSPYIFKNININDYKLFVFQRNDQTELVEIMSSNNMGKLYGIPTWGEINWYAYKLPTLEFHDELYGYLHNKYILNGSSGTEKDRSYLDHFEKNFLQTVKIGRRKCYPKRELKVWYKESWSSGGSVFTKQQVSLSTYIRNKLHHPENERMKHREYTTSELQKSIKNMIEMV